MRSKKPLGDGGCHIANQKDIQMNERVTNAKAMIDGATKDLINAYLETIRQIYETREKQRGHIQEGLERFVAGIEEGKIPHIVLIDDNSSLFSPEKAKEIREAAGLSLRQLSNSIGLTKSALSDYEKGKFPRKATNSRKYLSWLKERGYNPFKI